MDVTGRLLGCWLNVWNICELTRIWDVIFHAHPRDMLMKLNQSTFHSSNLENLCKFLEIFKSIDSSSFAWNVYVVGCGMLSIDFFIFLLHFIARVCKSETEHTITGETTKLFFVFCFHRLLSNDKNFRVWEVRIVDESEQRGQKTSFLC